MALSRLSNPQDTVTAITAALWTSEFDNIYNNALALISPLTGALNFNGFALQGLSSGTAGSPGASFTGDADTGVFRVGADEVGLAAGGATAASFTNPALAVNSLKWSGSATGAAVTGTATGTDVNVSVNLVPKGTGTVQANAIDVVTVSGTQTLTNKTLTTPTIASFVNAVHTHTAAAGGGQIAAGGYAAGSIVDADISATAAIGVSKLNSSTGTATVGVNGSFGVNPFTFGGPTSGGPAIGGVFVGVGNAGTRQWQNRDGTLGGTWTWQFLQGSGNPHIWAWVDAAGRMVSSWESEDPADEEFPDLIPLSAPVDAQGVALPGLTAVRLAPLTEPMVTVLQAALAAAPPPAHLSGSIYAGLPTARAIGDAIVATEYRRRGLEVPPDIREVFTAVSDPQARAYRLHLWLRAVSRLLHDHRAFTLLPLLQARCRVSPTGVVRFA